MKTKLSHKIFSLLLIPIVLFSTTSFSMQKHECKGHITSFSFLGRTEKCGMEMKSCDMDEMSCGLSEMSSEAPDFLVKNDLFSDNSDDCCHDIEQFFPGSSITIQDNLQLTKLQTVFISAFTLSFLHNAFITEKYSSKYKNYSPPLILRNINILFQVFII